MVSCRNYLSYRAIIFSILCKAIWLILQSLYTGVCPSCHKYMVTIFLFFFILIIYHLCFIELFSTCHCHISHAIFSSDFYFVVSLGIDSHPLWCTPKNAKWHFTCLLKNHYIFVVTWTRDPCNGCHDYREKLWGWVMLYICLSHNVDMPNLVTYLN